MSIAKLVKLFLPIFVTLPALYFVTQPIFHDGLFQTMDDIQVLRIDEMYKELKSGQFPVRIASDLGNGAGYMLFNFYSPLVYYIGALFHFLGFTLVISTKLVFLLGFLIAWLGIYLLLKYKFNTITAISGTVLFLFSPYLGYDAYHRGALAEFFAYCLLPFIFFFLLKLSEKKSIFYFLSFSISLASLVISHNLTTMITLPFIIIAILIFFRGNYILGSSSLLLGLSISSFYWMPALFEKKYINIENVDFITKTYQNHFFSPLQLIGFEKIPWGFLPPILGITIFLGTCMSAILLVLKYFKFIFKEDKKDQFTYFCILSFFLCLFMASNLSKLVWEILSPPLNFLQFPWRFLTLASFFGVIGCSYLIYKTKPLKDKITVIILLTLSLIIINSRYFQPVSYNFVARYTADDYCGTAGWSNEYIPIWVKECFPEGTKIGSVNPNNYLKVTNLQISNHSRNYQFLAESTTSAKVIFDKYYFPGWQLQIDGKTSPIAAVLPYGLIQATIPSGKHYVNLDFNDTPARTLANFLSLAGIIISLYLLKGAFNLPKL